MKNIKRIIAIVISMLLVISSVVTVAAEESNFSGIVSKPVEVSENGDVKLLIDIAGNPGITAIKLWVSYDPNVLTVKENGIKDTGLLVGKIDNTFIEGRFPLSWQDSGATAANNYANGTIAEIEFEVSEYFAGSTDVNVTIEFAQNFVNGKFGDAPAMQDGVITITRETPAENSKLLWTNNFEEREIDDVLTGNWPTSKDETAISSSSFYAKTGSPSNKLNTTTVLGDDTNKYIETTHNRLGYNPYKDNTAFAGFGYGEELSVYSTSYDIMIPADDPYKANRRYALMDIGSVKYVEGSTTKLDYKQRAVRAGANFVDGKIIGTATGSTTLYYKELDYTYGEWVSVRIDGWIKDQKVYTAIYADDKLIYAGEQTSATTLGMTAYFTEFSYANIESGATLASEAKSSGIESVTNYDNFKVLLLTADNELTAEEIAAQKEFDDTQAAIEKSKTPQVTLHMYTADTLGKTAGTSGAAVFADKGELKTNLVQGSSSDEHTADAYEVIDGSYTNITSSSYKYLVANTRESFAHYVQTDAKNTFVYSMYLNFKDFSAQMNNTFAFGVDLSGANSTAPDGSTVTARKTNDIVTDFTGGTDGNISFGASVTSKGKIVPDKLRSESRPVTAGEWINVKMVYEILHGETQYTIKMYGIYEDAVIYENEFTLDYYDHDKDGKADDIHVGMVTFNIGTDNTKHTETVIGINDICFEKNNYFDWSAVDTDNWINRNVSLVLDADGNVDVEAKRGGAEGFTSGVLAVALYDADGRVIELIKEVTITDGKFVYEVPASKVATAKTIKAFVFDSIVTTVPLMRHGVIEFN